MTDPTNLVERLQSAYSTVFERSLAREAATALASLADELRLAREALHRLGSMEAFKGPRAVNEHDTELLARIEFARAAMKEPRS